MTSARVGFLIYSGVIPLIKTYLTILCGYVLARNDLFPPAAARGASHITLNVSLPALIFSSILPAFSPSNVSAIGPLLLSAFVYQGIGLLLGLIIRELCYVPRNFYQGLLVLTTLSNWGNLPTAVVLTVTQQAPFNPSRDPALGVSFVAIFILVYNVVFWLFGAAHSLSWDYLPSVPQGVEAERRLSWKEKPIGGWICYVLLGKKRATSGVGLSPQPEHEKMKGDTHVDVQRSLENNEITTDRFSRHDDTRADSDVQRARHTSRVSILSSPPSLPTMRNQSDIISRSPRLPVEFPTSSSTPSFSEPTPSVPTQHGSEPLRNILRHVLAVILTPSTLSVLIAIPIALIQPLKALFIDTTSTGGPHWKGPDGRPPLYFVMDTAASLGGITVPMALILLGASFARLSIPRPLSRLAIPAMLAVSLAKMLVIPVIGIIMVQAMVQRGLIPRENIVERFVAIFLAGTPASVNQLVVSQLLAPEGNVDTLSAFLLVQYALMFFASAALTAVSLSLL